MRRERRRAPHRDERARRAKLCRETVAHTHGQEEACNRDDSTGRRDACSSLKQLRARIAKRRRQEMRLTITPPRCGGGGSGVARRRGGTAKVLSKTLAEKWGHQPGPTFSKLLNDLYGGFLVTCFVAS